MTCNKKGKIHKAIKKQKINNKSPSASTSKSKSLGNVSSVLRYVSKDGSKIFLKRASAKTALATVNRKHKFIKKQSSKTKTVNQSELAIKPIKKQPSNAKTSSDDQPELTIKPKVEIKNKERIPTQKITKLKKQNKHKITKTQYLSSFKPKKNIFHIKPKMTFKPKRKINKSARIPKQARKNKSRKLKHASKTIRHFGKKYIIKYPVVNETAMRSIEKNNTLVFAVHRSANNNHIRKAVQQIYTIEAVAVNSYISSNGKKKAYVKLPKRYDALEMAHTIGII